MRELKLVLPYPVSANRYWKPFNLPVPGHPGKFRLMNGITKEAKDYKAAVAAIVRAHGIGEPMRGRLAIAYTLYPHRPLDFAKRMRQHGEGWDDTVMCLDLDNAQKVLFDSLKGVAIEDDKWIWRIEAWRGEPDAGGERVEVVVRELVQTSAQSALFGAAA